MPKVLKFLRFFLSRPFWVFIGWIVITSATFYSYEEYSKPILNVTSPTPGIIKHGKNDVRFEIPFKFENSGNSSAINVEMYHSFFNWPPGWGDKAFTEIPDGSPKNQTQDYVIIKYQNFKSFQASINFFHYQNVIVITRWKSENLAHFGQNYFQAQWYRLFYLPDGKSVMSMIKSRFYRSLPIIQKGDFETILKIFVKGETLSDAYNTEQLDWERRARGE